MVNKGRRFGEALSWRRIIDEALSWWRIIDEALSRKIVIIASSQLKGTAW